MAHNVMSFRKVVINTQISKIADFSMFSGLPSSVFTKIAPGMQEKRDWGNGGKMRKRREIHALHFLISSFSLYFLPRPSVGALKFRKPYKGNQFLSN